MSMNEKLAYLAETKEQIKAALVNKGATIDTSTTFRKYVDKINEIETVNNQDKTITENGTYTADEGYTGLGNVVVNVQSGGGAVEGIKQFASVEEMNATTGEEGDLAVVYSNNVVPFTQDSTIQVLKFPDKVVLDAAITSTSNAYLVKSGLSTDRLAQLSLTKTAFRVRDYTTSEYVAQYTSTDGITYTRTTTTLELDLGNPAVFSGTWNDAFGEFFKTGSVNFDGLFEFLEGSWQLTENQFTVSKSSDLLPNKSAYGSKGIVVGDDSFYNNTFGRKILNNVFGVDDELENCPTVAITTQSLKFNANYKTYQTKRFVKGSATDYRLGIIDTSKTPERISMTSSGTSVASGMEVCSDAVVRFTGSDAKLFVCAMEDGTILKGGLAYNYKEYCFPYNGSLHFVGTTVSGSSTQSVLRLNASSLGSYTTLGTACDTSSKVLGVAKGTIWSMNTSSSGTNAGTLYKFNLSTNTQTTQSLGAIPYIQYMNVDDAVFFTGVPSSDNTKIRFLKLTDTVEKDVLLPRPSGTVGNQTVMYIDESGAEPIYYVHHSTDNYIYSYQESVGYTKLHYCQYSGRSNGVVINNGLISCYGNMAYTSEEWLNNDTYFLRGNYPVCGGKFLKDGYESTTYFVDISDVGYIKETPEGQSSEFILKMPTTTGAYTDSTGLVRGYMCHKL